MCCLKPKDIGAPHVPAPGTEGGGVEVVETTRVVG